MEERAIYYPEILNMLTDEQVRQLIDQLNAVRRSGYGSVRLVVQDGEVAFLEQHISVRVKKTASRLTDG